MRAWASSPPPLTIRLPLCLSLRLVTLSARSPWSSVAFHSNGSRSVRDATYLGMLFI